MTASKTKAEQTASSASNADENILTSWDRLWLVLELAFWVFVFGLVVMGDLRFALIDSLNSLTSPDDALITAATANSVSGHPSLLQALASIVVVKWIMAGIIRELHPEATKKEQS